MIKRFFLIIFLLGLVPYISHAQGFVKTSDLFLRTAGRAGAGNLRIYQDPSLDTIIYRYILGKQRLYEKNTYYGMEGYRIQIYNSSNRNAREESAKVRAEFISRFPDIPSYQLFADPGYFKIRVGDFRTKTEATRLFMLVSRQFPDAYLVPDFINFPDLNLK
jgi:hypothetical protein